MSISYQNFLEQFFHSEKVQKYDLENITQACEYFDNPQKYFKSIHIAGTNGKGSVSKMIFQILKESGKKVGVYTSPHNIDIRERFETEDWLISEKDFVDYAERIIAYGWGLSYYEKCVMLAFLYFRDRGCEYAVIEVGMGGRLDATNIITPILSIITSISYDHMEFLGDTLVEIATEKWGIIKPNIPVILYEKNDTLMSIAEKNNSPVIFPKKREIRTNLIGQHQFSNARIAYQAWLFLWTPIDIIEHALISVNHEGRLQYLLPNLLIDWAHNEDGMKKLRIYLRSQRQHWEEIIYCFNLKKGKPATLVFDSFPEVRSWIVVDSPGYLVQSPSQLMMRTFSIHRDIRTLDPVEIFEFANQQPRVLFVVFGSLYILSDFLSLKSNSYYI